MVDLSVCSAIVAVGVAEHGGGYHEVVHGCVEDSLLHVIVALYGDTGELLLPLRVGSADGSVEVPARQLGFHVSFGTHDVDG